MYFSTGNFCVSVVFFFLSLYLSFNILNHLSKAEMIKTPPCGTRALKFIVLRDFQICQFGFFCIVF